jgi:hypothetical protein
MVLLVSADCAEVHHYLEHLFQQQHAAVTGPLAEALFDGLCCQALIGCQDLRVQVGVPSSESKQLHRKAHVKKALVAQGIPCKTSCEQVARLEQCCWEHTERQRQGCCPHRCMKMTVQQTKMSQEEALCTAGNDSQQAENRV